MSRRQQQVLTRLTLRSIEHGTVQAELRPADIKQWFEIAASTARNWLREWEEDEFVQAVSTEGGQRVRRFELRAQWVKLVEASLAKDR